MDQLSESVILQKGMRGTEKFVDFNTYLCLQHSSWTELCITPLEHFTLFYADQMECACVCVYALALEWS